MPTGCQYVEAARPLLAGTNVHTDAMQNHGGLALIYHDDIKVAKKSLDVSVTTFEYLYAVVK